MADTTARPLDRLSERVTLWLARAGCVALTAMMLLTFFDVIGRALNRPLIFTVEVTELLMGLVVYLAIGYTTFTRGHINVDLVVIRLPPRAKAAFEVFTTLVSIVFVVLISWYLFERAGIIIEKDDRTQIMRWPVWPAAIVMAAASVFMVTSLLIHLVDAVRTTAQSPSARC